MPPPMNILIASLGSHGDVHPFIGIGKGLAGRGHRVTLIAPAVYEDLVRQTRLDFAAVGSAERFREFARDPNLWHPRKGFHAVAAAVVNSIPDYYQAVVDRYEPGKTLLLISSLALGAKAARDKFDIPSWTIHLSPSVIRSVIAPAKTPPLPIAAWQPMWFKRFLYNAADFLAIDPALTRPLDAFRKTVGLPLAPSLFKFDPQSTEKMLCLTPEWFAPRPLDWPEFAKMTNFPLYDEADVTPMSDDLQKFLAAGDPPIVFTPGSAMSHGGGFFNTAIQICQKINRRGLLLSRHTDHLPTILPPEIRHELYAPFSQLLPRSAALVHHGGIGTMSQALAAGVPQLLTPFGFDQFDNADRAQRLGVARWIPALKLNPDAATTHLKYLLESPQVAGACAEVKNRFRGIDPLKETLDALGA
jgi:UDP:flavonoid glycosyltransferase YjiC (YdhE family)